jgi:hypothetical protein
MARYHGKKGVLYISTSASGTASAAIGLSTWSLNMATDKVDVSAFGDTNKTYVQGLKDLQGAVSGFWDDTETKVFGAADSADGCKLYLYPSSDAPTKYWYGTAWLDASIDTGVSAAVAISGTFVAASSWSRM